MSCIPINPKEEKDLNKDSPIFATSRLSIMHFFLPPKLLHKHCFQSFSISWDDCKSQVKMKTMHYGQFRGGECAFVTDIMHPPSNFARFCETRNSSL